VNEQGEKQSSRRFECCEVLEIREYFDSLDTFKAVIEASSSYRWLYDLVSKYGKVVLAHPYRLRAIVAGRAKTDKLDAGLLANLLRVNMIPKSYVPPAD